MKQHRLAAFGLVAGLLGGGAAGMALGLPGFAGAQTGPALSSTAPADPNAPAKPDRGARMRDALAPLVANNTISQAQADAVIAALEAARPAKGPGHHGFRGKGGRGIIAHGLQAAAGAIGVTAEELRTALRDGRSVADVARSKNVDPEKVVSALAGELKTRLDKGVAAGKITQAQADEKLARATERIRAFVNGEAPWKGFGHRHGPHGARPGDTPAAPSRFTPSNATISA